MGVLDQLNQLRNQGMTDSQAISRLQEQGISPAEISEAFNQAQVKNAIEGSQTPENQGYTPSIVDRTGQDESYYQGQETPQYSQEDQQAPPQYNNYNQQSPQYSPQENYSSGADANTMIEIAEQVFEEKTDKIKKQMEAFNEFKVLAETKINNISQRLERMESMFDKMQISILNEVGSFGRKMYKNEKELEMVQDSFSKVVGDLTKKHHK